MTIEVGKEYRGWMILHNALSAPEYRFEATKGESRLLGSSLMALKNRLDEWLAQVDMAEAWEQAENRTAQLHACLGDVPPDQLDLLTKELAREMAITLHRHRIKDYMHFTPVKGITPCCRKDLIGDGERQHSLDDWAKAPNITGCPFCHRSWCD